MRISPKGQVTIPARIRRQAGLKPNAKVKVSYDGGAVRIEREQQLDKAKRHAEVRAYLKRVAGSITPNLTTDKIMQMTRGE